MLGLQGYSNGPQQQSHQQPQQPQQQQGPQPGSIPPPPPQSGQDFTLSSVLHFLQTEWRRYERDRNEWEIERAEMRARIALLEGERRSFDNIKVDLMRRIKMLEFALRMERTKQLAGPGSGSGNQSVPPSKLASIQAAAGSASGSQPGDAGSHKDDSGGSSPRSENSQLPSDNRIPNGAPSVGPSGRPLTWAGSQQLNPPNGTSGGVGALGKPSVGRDPKSRAKSRDYLKQCLQEVSYLTSPQAMNPLPNRPLISSSNLPLSLPNLPSFDQMPYNGRPRKVMPDVGKDFPALNGMGLMSGPPSAPASTAAGSQIPLLERGGQLGSQLPQQQQQQQQQQPQPQAPPPPPPQAALQQVALHPANEQGAAEPGAQGQPQQLTAIFRPDDAGEWKEKLRASHEAAEQARLERAAQLSGEGWTREEEVKLDGDDDDDTAVGMEGEAQGDDAKVWKAKRTLRNHLDAVRTLAFHPTDLCLATGGDDCTVKIWRMDVASMTSSAARPTTEVEPQLTLRGHSAAITRLIHSPSKGLLYSASLDSSIRIWALPNGSSSTYAPYDHTRARGELIGHTDAVWDLALVRDESTLISCGAEGAVKVWDVSGPSGGGSLMLTWGFAGLEGEDELAHDDESVPGCTAVEAIKTDLKKVAVAYQTSVVKIFDIESGKEVSRLTVESDGTSATQINSLASHPTMPILVTAHEDKHIRLYDISTGQCTHSMVAHLDGVTSLAIDASGFSLVSGSHDCSVRFWDLLGSRACVQEITNHREKAREGVLAVQFHPTLPFMASAGADGVVKLFASS